VRMSVSNQRSGSLMTVAVSGEVDLSTGADLENAITGAVHAEGVTEVLIDLSAVDFLDSSGIALLLRGRRAADARGVAYRVVDAHGITRQVLEITGVWAHLVGDPGHNQPTTP